MSAHSETYRLYRRALRRGEITRPDRCEECGIRCVPDGHHEDYSKPLEVQWLCKPCHAKADWAKATAGSEHDDLMTAEELAEYIRIAPGTIYNWVSSDTVDIPYMKLGRAVRFRRTQIDAWIDTRAA